MDAKLVIDHIAQTCSAYSALPKCPKCGVQLVAAYDEAGAHGLTMTVTCSADCGYVRRTQPLQAALAADR
jgi:hypothetical protein